MPTDRHGCAASASLGLKSGLAGLLLLGLVAFDLAHAQPQAANGTASNGTAAKAPASTRPLWTELTASQQRSLAPLAPHWNTLHPAQKRKWIALAGNFENMSPGEQEVLHSRMTEWAALSAQDRTRARLNFAEVKRLAPEDERKAKWEAYQALSEEEKRKLAEKAGTRPPSAAAPVRPVPAQKFAPVPSVAATGNPFPPRIQLAPPATSTPIPLTPPTTAATATSLAPSTSMAPAASVAPTVAPVAPVAPAPPVAPEPPVQPRLQEAP